jgi:ketosteroid isomerase-like protein
MSEENVEIVRRLIDAARREDGPAALACLDPDVEWIPLRAATEGAPRGHDGFERFVVDTNENFETFEPNVELRDLGEQVLAWGTMRVRGRGSGIETDIPTWAILDFRAGRILRCQAFGSREEALEATGLSE